MEPPGRANARPMNRLRAIRERDINDGGAPDFARASSGLRSHGKSTALRQKNGPDRGAIFALHFLVHHGLLHHRVVVMMVMLHHGLGHGLCILGACDRRHCECDGRQRGQDVTNILHGSLPGACAMQAAQVNKGVFCRQHQNYEQTFSKLARLSEATSGAFICGKAPHIAALMRATRCRMPTRLPDDGQIKSLTSQYFVCPALSEKIFFFSEHPITPIFPPSRPTPKGRFAIVTSVGAGCGGRGRCLRATGSQGGSQGP